METEIIGLKKPEEIFSDEKDLLDLQANISYLMNKIPDLFNGPYCDEINVEIGDLPFKRIKTIQKTVTELNGSGWIVSVQKNSKDFDFLPNKEDFARASDMVGLEKMRLKITISKELRNKLLY